MSRGIFDAKMEDYEKRDSAASQMFVEKAGKPAGSVEPNISLLWSADQIARSVYKHLSSYRSDKSYPCLND